MATVAPLDVKVDNLVRRKRRWINSFLCSAFCPRKITPKTARVVAILDDFFKYSSFHGVRYIGKGTLGPWDNVIWLALIIISSGMTVWFTKAMFDRYRLTPTEIVVANSALPLWSFPFPAVTVCPTQKMNIPLAEKIITETIRNSSSFNLSEWSFDLMSGTNESDSNVTDTSEILSDYVTDVLNVLIDSEFPRIKELKPILLRLRRVKPLLPLLADLNVTKFMLQVLPHCNDFFRLCLWSGDPYDCCDLFQLQRTEVGFCYSFNSFTSEARSNCEDDPDLSDFGGTTSAEEKNNCTLHRTASAGPGSALKMYLQLPPIRNDNETAVALVTVGPPRDTPEPLTGVVVPGTPGITIQAPVSYQYTASASVLRSLPEGERGCLLANERRLRVTRFYSRRSCIFECRQDYIKRICGCLPYPYSSPGTGRECALDEYFCVSRVSGSLQFFTPPPYTPGFSGEDYNSTLNCSHCWRTCQAATYQMTPRHSSEPSVLQDVCVDVFFEVSLGGVANLFLGISYLSLLEIVVLLIKLCLAMRPIKRQ